MTKSKVGLQQPSKATRWGQFQFTLLIRLPLFCGGVNEVFRAMDGNGVVPTQPVNLSLKERQNGLPSRPFSAHWATMKREQFTRSLAAQGDAVSL